MSELEKIRAHVLDEARADRSRRGWASLSAALLSAHAVVGGLALVIALVGLGARVDGEWITAAVIAALVVVGVFAAVRPGGRAVRGLALALAAIGAIGTVLTSTGHHAPTWGWHDALCLAAEIGISALPTLATLIVLREFAPHVVRASVGGLGAGAVGVFVLHLTCPVEGPLHALAFHVAPWVMVTFAVVAIRARLSSRSFAP